MINPLTTTTYITASTRKKIGMLLGGTILLICVALMLIFIFQDDTPDTQITTTSKFNPIIPPYKANNPVIGKVGNETIYQRDLDIELINYPDVQGVDKKALLLQKIAKDSIILQAAKEEGLIKLDETVFNAPKKDYAKRVSLIAEIMEEIEQKNNTIKGSAVAIWFFNGIPGSVGYEKGKEIAFSKITELHAKVQSKKMTMQQAAEAIKSDTSLQTLDLSYKVNALLKFEKDADDTITIDPAFDAIIRKLQPGEISAVYLAKSTDPDTKQKRDSFYAFAEITKNTGVPAISFDEWYKEKEKNYEVTY